MAAELAASRGALDVGELVLDRHCSGALLAYEVALRLRQQTAGDKPLTLVVSSCAAPVWRAWPRLGVDRMSDEDLLALMTDDGVTNQALVRIGDFFELTSRYTGADLMAMGSTTAPGRHFAGISRSWPQRRRWGSPDAAFIPHWVTDRPFRRGVWREPFLWRPGQSSGNSAGPFGIRRKDSSRPRGQRMRRDTWPELWCTARPCWLAR